MNNHILQQIKISLPFSCINFISLVIFFAPLYLIHLSFFKIPTNMLEIFILASIFFCPLSIIKSIIPHFLLHKKYFIFILFLLLGLFLSSFYGNNPLSELGIVKSWFLFPLLFLLLLLTHINTFKKIEIILKSYFFSALIASLIGIIYLITHNLTYDNRLKLFYLSPNHFSMFLAPAILIGFYCIYSNPKIKSLWIFQFILLLNFYFTYSYSAWLAVAVGIFFFTFFTFKNYSSPKSSHILTFLVLTAILFLSQIQNPKIQNIFSSNNHSSIESRLIIWKVSKKIISDNLLLGIGPGNFQETYLSYQKYFPPYPEWAVPQPHNILLAFWLQTGLIGVLSFCLLILFWFKELLSFTAKSNNAHFKKIGALLLAILIYILVHGLFDTPYWKNDLSLYFWTFFALGLILQKNIKE